MVAQSCPKLPKATKAAHCLKTFNQESLEGGNNKVSKTKVTTPVPTIDSQQTKHHTQRGLPFQDLRLFYYNSIYLGC